MRSCDPRERSRIGRPGSDRNADALLSGLRSHLVSSFLLCHRQSSPLPCLVPSQPLYHSLFSSCSPSHPLPPTNPVSPRLTLLPRSPASVMHHIVTWVGRRHKGKAQQKSAVRSGTSTSQLKGESEKKKDVEATPPCHVVLGSGDASPLNSTSRSNDEDVSACNDDAITERYLLCLAPPYNRQTGPYHSNCGASDTNFSLSDFSGQHTSHLTTH